MKRVIYALFFCLFLLFMLSCESNNVTGTVEEEIKNSDYNNKDSLEGDIYNIYPELDLIDSKNYEIITSSLNSSNLPPIVDLEEYFPAPGKQQGKDCVSWAVTYAYLSFLKAQEYGWDVNTHTFSPAYSYNMGFKEGEIYTFEKELEVLKKYGGLLTSSMPLYSTDKPSEELIKIGKNYKIKDYYYVQSDYMKSFLAEKVPILIPIKLGLDFHYLDDENPIFDNISDFMLKSKTGHAIVLIGYDDSKKAYKFINSHGKEYGINGYGWISYELVEKYFSQGIVVDRPKPNIVSINISTSKGGRIMTEDNLYLGSFSVYSGWTKTIKALPDEGYHFIRYNGDISSTSSIFNLTANKNMSINAVFEKDNSEPVYNLNISNSNGGSVSATGYTFKTGQQVTVTAKSNSGNEFDYFKINGNIIKSNPYTFIMKSDVTVEGIFKKINENPYKYYSLKVNNSKGGYTSYVKSSYVANTTVKIQSYCDNGYKLNYWQVGTNKIYGETLSLLMTQNYDITPIFKELYYTSGSETTNGQKITNNNQYSVNNALQMKVSINGDRSSIIISKQSGVFQTSGTLIITTGDINNLGSARKTFRVNKGDSSFEYLDSLSAFDSLNPTYSYPKKFFAIYRPDGQNYIYWVGGITIFKR